MTKLTWMTVGAAAIALAGCPFSANYTVGGTLTGLHGAGLVLQDNSGKQLGLDANGRFTLSDRLQHKETYSVTVVTQPSNPAQTCSVRNGSGTIGKSNVTNVIVNCIEAGRFAYVANQVSNNISAYAIESSGALSEIAGSPFATSEAMPLAATVDQNGQFLYVANNGSNNVSVFAIDRLTGALTSPGFPAPTGTGPAALTVDPTDRFLYVANVSSNSVSAFSINQATGLLSAVAGSPFAIGLGSRSLTVDPNGKFLYAANFDGSDVSVLLIDQVSGALTAVSGSPLGVTTRPEALAVDPAGRYVYAANAAGNNEISTYSITTASGSLTLASSAASGVLPSSVAVDPAGGFVYVTNQGSDDISVYSVDSASGALTPVNGSPFAAGHGPRSIAID